MNNSITTPRPPGVKELIRYVNWKNVKSWADFGAGIAPYLEPDKYLSNLKNIYLVDSSRSRLASAEQRLQAIPLPPPVLSQRDLCFFVPNEPLDLVTLPYTMTKTRDWFLLLENIEGILKPGGVIALVDHFVARETSDDPRQNPQSALSRKFWPWRMARENIFLSPDHIPYLKNKFETLYFEDRTTKIPYLPFFMRSPSCIFIGRKAVD